MGFDIDFKERSLLKLHIRKFLLYPKYWDDIKNHYAYKLKWKSVKFKKGNERYLPEKKGLYCFVVEPVFPNFINTKYFFYVGQTTRTLRKRFVEYINDQEGKGKPRPKVYEMLKLYKNHIQFHYTILTSKTQIDEIEQKIINTFVPPINTEIPVAKIKKELRNIYE